MRGLDTEIAAIIHGQMDLGAIGGAVVLVQKGGELISLHAHGYADFDPAFKLDPDSIFGVMSMSKPVAAACAMMLVSAGKVALDDLVSKFIPEFAAPRYVRTLRAGETYPPFPLPPGSAAPAQPLYDYAPAQQKITVRHLLNFTSGLQIIGVPNGASAPRHVDTLETYIAGLNSLPLEFEPGTQWAYSNATGYDVLGRIVEVASGESLQDFVQKHLFDPLEMHSTQFGANPRSRDRIVPLGFLESAPVVRTDYPSGSAGLFSTARDYSSFAEMLLNDGLYRGRRVMAEDAVKAMRSPQIGNLPFAGIRASDYAKPVVGDASAFTYGYGLGLVAARSADLTLPVGSYGWDGVGTRRFWIIPSLRIVLIMLMPGIGTAAEPAHRAIEEAVVRRLAVA